MIWKSVRELENRNGVLYFGGCSVLELAGKYGTPLYVYSESRIRENYRRLLDAYKKRYPQFKVYYAIKANNNPAIVNILRSEGAGADASCVPEIKMAQQAGMPNEDTLYSGVYNSDDELRYAVENNVRINLEDISQLERLKKMKVPAFLCFRINPGMGSGKFQGLVFAGPDAKFGIIERDVKKAYETAKSLGVESFGIHMMTGSCILNPDYFEQVVGKLLDIAGPIAQQLGIKFDFIDIGGSLGVPYTPDEEELDMDMVAEKVVSKLKEKLAQYDMGEPFLIHEPGRYLVCDAGILVARVCSIKSGYKKFIGIDAGMNNLMRVALYDAYHHILYANNLGDSEREAVNIVGQICENTDQFAKGRMMPKSIKVGDVLAILDVGTYGFGMGSQYNSRPRPAEVLVCNGASELIRQRESFGDLIRGTAVPKRLQYGKKEH
ncbi:diaminopimelate decarboxylase [Candidatus Woesearchaeota archaeon]|nr:diaminopimelate decarboxylase [Candidatus Woesearchaeota archaeon]